MKLSMFGKFPRQISLQRFFIWGKQELFDYINLYNGKLSVYTSVYAFDKWNGDFSYEFARVDKAFFDIDEMDYESMMKLHDYLEIENYAHRANFSGGGFHVFVLLEEENLKNKRDALYNFQLSLKEKVGFVCDTTTFGDLARICRVTNTFNMRRKRFDIPLSHDDLHKGLNHIINLSSHQQPESSRIGDNLVSLLSYDTNARCNIDDTINVAEIGEDIWQEFSDFPPCIQRIMTYLKNAGDGDKTWDVRAYLVLFLNEIGYDLSEILGTLKFLLSERRFKHLRYTEKQHISLINSNAFCPSCRGMEKRGYCNSKCGRKYPTELI